MRIKWQTKNDDCLIHTNALYSVTLKGGKHFRNENISLIRYLKARDFESDVAPFLLHIGFIYKSDKRNTTPAGGCKVNFGL